MAGHEALEISVSSDRNDGLPVASEKEKQTGDTKVLATKPESRSQEASLQDNDARSDVDESEYPDSSTLITISIALCLAILPVALVWIDHDDAAAWP